MTGSASLWPPFDRGSSGFVLATASAVPSRVHNTATTPRRTIVVAYPVSIVVDPQVVLLLRLRQHHHHRPNRTVETSFAVDIAALTGTPAIFDFSDSAAEQTATTTATPRFVAVFSFLAPPPGATHPEDLESLLSRRPAREILLVVCFLTMVYVSYVLLCFDRVVLFFTLGFFFLGFFLFLFFFFCSRV